MPGQAAGDRSFLLCSSGTLEAEVGELVEIARVDWLFPGGDRDEYSSVGPSPVRQKFTMLSNLPFDEAVVEPRIIVAEERIQNGGLAGVFSRLAGGAGFRGYPGAGKRMLRKKRFTGFSEDSGGGRA